MPVIQVQDLSKDFDAIKAVDRLCFTVQQGQVFGFLGHNGAGKSSLLDAITWALFGEARKRGEELIHNACESAEVALTFAYESSRYRIRRSLTHAQQIVGQGLGVDGGLYGARHLKWLG